MNIKIFVLAACTAIRLAGGDMLMLYSTRGIDRYLSGEPVKDGECYALVYTRPGKVFNGFQADGAVADPEASDLVLTAPVAKDGRCPPVLFQVREQYAASRRDGGWEVFLVDTRNANGFPTGLNAAGRLRRINGWRRVSGCAYVNFGKMQFSQMANSNDVHAAGAGGNKSVMPPDAPKPRITDIKIKNGIVELCVTGTVPYATYDLDAARELRFLGRHNGVARTPKDGVLNEPIKLEADMGSFATNAPVFFRVFRN